MDHLAEAQEEKSHSSQSRYRSNDQVMILRTLDSGSGGVGGRWSLESSAEVLNYLRNLTGRRFFDEGGYATPDDGVKVNLCSNSETRGKGYESVLADTSDDVGKLAVHEPFDRRTGGSHTRNDINEGICDGSQVGAGTLTVL